MAVINRAKREINAKIVFFGPPGSGKGSLFSFIHKRIKPTLCGPLKSMPAGGSSLLFFDYIPFENAALDGYKVRFHLYTLTGPVENQGTWKMVLKGVDGLALVSESGDAGALEGCEYLLMLRSILSSYGRTFEGVPSVLISAKTDLHEGYSGEPWKSDFPQFTHISASTVTGDGVLNALASLSQAVVRQLQYEQEQAPIQNLCSADAVVEEPIELAEQEIAAENFELPVEISLPRLTSGCSPVTLKIPVNIDKGGGSRKLMLRLELSIEDEMALF